MATELTRKIDERAGNIALHPGIVGLVSLTGAFNVSEWRSIAAKDRTTAESIALEQLKDMALVAEGVRAGAGILLQNMILDTKEIDEEILRIAESERIRKPVHLLITPLEFARDLSSFMQFGNQFSLLDEEEQSTALQFGIVTDFGHFSRIMQKDAIRADVHRHWLVDQVSQAFERNLNAAYTHRNQDDALYPIPPQAAIGAKLSVVESLSSGENVMMVSERAKSPNITFSLAIANPEKFIPIEVTSSKGRGEIRSGAITSTSGLLTYLSHQFESLLVKYPLEKSALIFDKYIYKLGIGNFGIQLTAVQSIKTQESFRSKILQVGDIDIAVLRERSSNVNPGLIMELRSGISDARLYEIYQQLSITRNEINDQPPPYTPRKKQRLAAQVMEQLRAKKITLEPVNQEKNNDGLGTIEQAKHKIIEMEIKDGDSFIFLPPSIGARLAGAVHKFADISYIITYLSNLNTQRRSSYSFSRFKFLHRDTQILRQIEWTTDTVLPQVAEFLDYLRGLTREFNTVDLHFQFSHIHPTSSTHSKIQEVGAKIAGILGNEVRRFGVRTRGSSLVDEYHTDDLLKDYSVFEDMLRQNADSTFTEIFYESSPVMRLIADAVVRLIIQHPDIQKIGDTISLLTQEGRMIEIWDNVTEKNDGAISIGRQACVPFNIGMDLTMMAPQLSDVLYRQYISLRYPNSILATLLREHSNLSVHEIFTRFIMNETNVEKRSLMRHHILDEADRVSFSEIEKTNPDITAFDLYVLYELYQFVQSGLSSKKRIPIVVHILETNYNAQQEKARHIWDMVGIPGVPVFRISFDPFSGNIKVLTSPPPEEDKLGQFFSQPDITRTVQKLKEQFGI
ncbi:hypothetical protein HY041_03550 [Candidatus Roizmanbacteria bacterium]|nr:hypothetical protein [Candidatus Roizmanbacteria bacterium]